MGIRTRRWYPERSNCRLHVLHPGRGEWLKSVGGIGAEFQEWDLLVLPSYVCCRVCGSTRACAAMESGPLRLARSKSIEVISMRTDLDLFRSGACPLAVKGQTMRSSAG